MFTQEQINEIREKLALSGSKDKSLPLASLPLSGKEILALVQDGKNKSVPIEEFFEEFAQYIDGSERVDFFNVSRYAQRLAGAAASVQLTLDDAVELCPVDVRRGGQVITFVDYEGNWTLWQYNGTTPEGWLDTSTKWVNIETDPNLGIVFTSSLTGINSGETATTTLHFETKDGGNAAIVKLYENGTLFHTYNHVSNFDLEKEISGESTITIKVTQYGYVYEKSVSIPVTYKAWVGSGSVFSDIQVSANEISVTSEINRAFNVTFESNAYFMLMVPSIIVLGPTKMNGLVVPMAAITTATINGVEYSLYKSGNQYVSGTHTFTVGTYEGSEGDSIVSMQQDIAGLQTLIAEAQETNTSQSQSISNLDGRTQALEEESLNTSDEEDITLATNHYKFANKAYNASGFSGKGRIYLRKNIVQITEIIDDNTTITRTINLLTQSMMSNVNTRYIVQYDYDLNGEEIILPEGCVIEYQGGSFSNGKLAIDGAYLLDGWVNLIGSDLLVTGIPAAGVMKWDTDTKRPYWSDGESSWLDAEGNPLE